MSTELATKPLSADIERVLIGGDLSSLNENQRLSYYNSVCESVGLNPLTRPFEYLRLNNKLTLYARKDCTDQLRKVHGVSVIIAAREVVEDVYVVTARATDKTGRQDEAIGAVPLKGLQGEARANAMMKAETKAKRRVTLSVCGLGMLDENEVESIPGAAVYTPPPPKQEAAPAGPKASSSAPPSATPANTVTPSSSSVTTAAQPGSSAPNATPSESHWYEKKPEKMRRLQAAVSKLHLGVEEAKTQGLKGAARENFVRDKRIEYLKWATGRDDITSTLSLHEEDADRVIYKAERGEVAS